MSRTSLVHQRLRAATGQAHKALEDELDAVEALTSSHGRRTLAPRYLAFHSFADAVVERWLADVADLHVVPRRRADLVRRDIAALGQIAPEPPPPPPIAGRAAALGFCYVVEGSTLGGRMILKAVASRGADTVGLGFIDPYGPRTGEAWRAFLEVLEREVGEDPARLDEAEAGALAGFAYARACLCG